MAGLDVPSTPILLLLSPLSTDQGQTPIANRQIISATRQTEIPKVSRGLVSSPVTTNNYATISLREERGLRLETRDPVSQAQASQPSHYRTFLRTLDLLMLENMRQFTQCVLARRTMGIQVCCQANLNQSLSSIFTVKLATSYLYLFCEKIIISPIVTLRIS